jgi:hypothetical protein
MAPTFLKRKKRDREGNKKQTNKQTDLYFSNTTVQGSNTNRSERRDRVVNNAASFSGGPGFKTRAGDRLS